MAKKSLFRRRSGKRGLPPGTPVYNGAARDEPVVISVFDYDESRLEEKTAEKIDDCFQFRESPSISWIDVTGIHDPDIVRSLGDHFGLHPLVQEDILSTGQRPKVEDYGDYLYVVLKMLRWDDTAGEMIVEQVSLVIGQGFVLSFQEKQGDVFDFVRDRLRTDKGRIRKMKSDYLAYSLLDAIIDAYFVVLEKLGDELEALEDETISDPTPKTREKIYRLRQEGLFLRKSVWPVREMVGAFERTESNLVSSETAPYFRDLYDHAVQVMDTAETFRETLSGMLDTYLSSISNRMNEVMKVLTIIATIFIPLTFVAGIYGMNFQYMPELAWRWAYPAVWIVMLAITCGMFVYFRRKRWL